MLYSFYLIVYLICISYYYYIILLYIPLFDISFFICRLYIGFLLSLIFFILCLLFLVIRIGIILSLTYVLSFLCVIFRIMFVFWGSRIISRISPYDDFYFVCVFGDHWLYVIYILSLTYDYLFYVFVLGYGYIILVILGLLNYLYHRTGIYLFDFFFVCVFWDPNVCDYIILIL